MTTLQGHISWVIARDLFMLQLCLPIGNRRGSVVGVVRREQLAVRCMVGSLHGWGCLDGRNEVVG